MSSLSSCSYMFLVLLWFMSAHYFKITFCPRKIANNSKCDHEIALGLFTLQLTLGHSKPQVKKKKILGYFASHFTLLIIYSGLTIKGLVHPKLKISLLFTHPQAILDVAYMTFFFQTNSIGVILKIVLALLSSISAVGRCFCLIVQNTLN